MPRRGKAPRGKKGGRGTVVVKGTPGFTRNVGKYGRFVKTKELKYFDTPITSTDAPTGGVIVPTLNLITQGAGSSDRIGRKAFVKRIQIKGHVVLKTESDVTPGLASGDRIRVMVYLDKQCNGTAATVGQLLQKTELNSWRDMEQVDRFRILHDKVYTLNRTSLANGSSSANVSGPSVYKMFNMGKNCNLELLFDASQPVAIDNVKSYNIGMLLISEHGRSAFKGECRIRFTD